MDLERFEDESSSLSLQAAGGNTRTARRLRVKSQLRDKKGRWVEMGRKASVDVKINGKKTKVQGRFVGSDPKAPGVRGLFLVEADEARGIKRGVYSFKGRAVNQVLATLDPEYLEDQGIKDPNRDVNNNLVGMTLDEDIEELGEVDFEEAGELDEALASGKLSSDEVSQAFNERARAGAYESYNVVATLEEADTEVLTEEQLGDILEDVGVTPDDFRRDDSAPAEDTRRIPKPGQGLPFERESKPLDPKDPDVGFRLDGFEEAPQVNLTADEIINGKDDPTFEARWSAWNKKNGGPQLIDGSIPAAKARNAKRDSKRRIVEKALGRQLTADDLRFLGLNREPESVIEQNRGVDTSNFIRIDGGDGAKALKDELKDKQDSEPDFETGTTRAASLQPGDEVKMPDGTFRTVSDVRSVDSGNMVFFEGRDGERRRTTKIYEDDEPVEIKIPEATVETLDSPDEFEQVKDMFNNPSDEEKAKPADQRRVQHWYVDEAGNVYPDREDKPAPPSNVISPESERFWDRETNKVFDGNGNELTFTPTYDDKFVPIPEDGDGVPTPMGESGFWDRNQLGVARPESSPQYFFSDNPEEIVDALAAGKFVKTTTVRAAYEAIKLAIDKKFKAKPGEKPSPEELETLKETIAKFPKGQKYQIKRAIDVDALNKQEVEELNNYLDAIVKDMMGESFATQLTAEQIAEVHNKFRNQPIDLTNLRANESTAYSQNNAGAIREEMPPLASFNRPIFEKDLDRLGINYTNEMMQADDMKPLQAEMSMDNVAGLLKAMEDGIDLWKGGKSRIYVDRDGNILDGHHRWAAVIALQWKDGEKQEIPVTRLDLPRDEALALMNEWANSRGIPGQKLVDNRMGIEAPPVVVEPAPAQEARPETTVGEETSNLPVPQYDDEKVRSVLQQISRHFAGSPNTYQGLDIPGFVSQETDDPDVQEAIDMAYYMSDIIERSNEENKEFLYEQLVQALKKNQLDKARMTPTPAPRPTGRANTVRKITARKEGATLDPITLRQPRTGISVAVQGTNEEVADALFFNMYLGDLIVADYIDKNKDKLREGFKLGTWHDKDNNEVTFDIVEVFPQGAIERATLAGQERNQQAIFDIKNKNPIDTGGTGDRGRARREREAQRQASDGRGAGPELGQPEPIGEVREGQEPAPGDARADGSDRDRLTIDRGSEDLVNVPASRRGEIDYGNLSFDLASLNTRQRQILKKIEATKKRIFKNITSAAKARDLPKFERNMNWGKSLKTTFERVFGDLSEGKLVSFGQGEKERLKNMTFFTNTEVFAQNGRLEGLEGVYVAKNGEVFGLKYNGSQAGVYRIDAEGKMASSTTAHVNLNWGGEPSRGSENPNYASIAYLQSGDGGKGLGGVAVTFARYVVEASGREFAHSYNLTPPGANNSKTIEPGDPRRHHLTQSEKVLEVMKAPTMELLKKQGWFTGEYSIFGETSLPYKLSKNFTKPLDVSGAKNNVNYMRGPIYQVDVGLSQALASYRSNVATQKRNYNVDVNVHPYAQDYLANDLFAPYRIQFDIEELNWQDGPSKESVIKKLKDTEDFLESAEKLYEILPTTQRVGYVAQGSGLQLSTLRRNFASIREGLEADSDFDSKRMPRPDKLDRSIPRRVKINISPLTKEDNSFSDKKVEPFAGISTAFDLEKYGPNTSLVGAYAALRRENYGATLGDDSLTAPAGWTRLPRVLARRFSVEQLKQSLEEGIQRTAIASRGGGDENIPKNFYAELDFRKDFATEPKVGLLPIASVAKALYSKSFEEGQSFDFEEYLAEQVDKAYGIDTNLKRIDDERALNQKYFEAMDEYLQEIGETREEEVATEVAKKVDNSSAQLTVKSLFDKERGTLSSEGRINDSSEEEQLREFLANWNLTDNERFEQLDNNLGELLTQAAPINIDPTDPLRTFEYRSELVEGGIDLSSISGAAQSIGARYRRKDLIESFKDALIRGNSTVKLEHPRVFGGTPKQYEIDIRYIRDVLQLMNVDTNGLIKSEVLPNLATRTTLNSDEVKALNLRGLTEPARVSDVIANANETFNIDSLQSVKTYGNGASKPELMLDTLTGKQYVVKRYENPIIAEMEITAQSLYRAAGVNASNPRFGRKTGDDSGYYIVTDYFPAAEDMTYRGRVTSLELGNTFETQGEARRAALNGIPMDILLDNIDGPYNSGNILYDVDGGYIRIDGGGALLSDPLDRIDDKQTSRRYLAMTPQGWNAEATPEQLRVMEIAKAGGSFEGEGIEFTYDLYLNPQGWHWNWEGGLRKDILEDFDEDQFKQNIRDTVLPLTPDKIAEIVDGMPITSDPSYKERIKEALIYRRAHMLNKFGIEDTYNPQERELESTPATEADRERLEKYVQDAFKNEDSEERDSLERTVSNPKTTKSQVENAIENLRPSINEKSEGESSQNKTGEAIEVLNNSGEKPDADGLSTDPLNDFEASIMDLEDTKPGDIIDDPFFVTNNGRVIFNIKTEDDTHKIGIRNERGELSVLDHDPSAQRRSRTVKRYISESKIPSETDFDPSMLEARTRFLSNINRRGNKVLQQVKIKYVNHTVLSNGDLVVGSRIFRTAGGKSYKYQIVVHRQANEEFVSYVREWEVDGSGAQISSVRVNKITKPTHSPKALLNKIQPLVKGPGVGQGVYGRNPRNWFNQGNSIEGEVTDPRTGMPIPSSLSVEPNVQYIENTGIRSTGDPAKDAVVSYVGSLVSRGIQANDIYRRLASNGILSRAKILDIIERVESNRAFPGINQIPYLSRNKSDIVRVGDRVRHYAPNGTIKEGVVRLRRPLSVNRKPNGDYNYTDVLVVKFDDRDQGTPIVAKNLEIIRRSDGEAADLGGEVPAELPRDFAPEMLSEPLPAHWTSSVSEAGTGRVEFNGPSDAPLITIIRVNDPFGRQRFVLSKYQSKDEGRNSRSKPQATYRFANLTSAVVTAENIIGSYEESKAEKNETPSPDANPDKLFQNAEGETNLESLAEAFRKNIGESGCALTASIESCAATQGIRTEIRSTDTDKFVDETGAPTVFTDDKGKPIGEYLKVFWDKMPKVNKKYVPTYWILKTNAGGKGKRAKKFVYWTNAADEGNKKKAKYLNILDGATFTEDQAAEKVRIDAEMRIDFLSGIAGDKQTRTLQIDLGDGKTFTEEIDFETWKELSISPVSKDHFTLGDDGTVQISEARRDFYAQEVALHLSGIAKPEGRKPTMFVLGGAPASGKGDFTKKDSVLSKMVEGLEGKNKTEAPKIRDFNGLTGIDQTPDKQTVTAVLVDPDIFKLRFPEVRISHLSQLYDRVLVMLKINQNIKRASNDNRWANNSHEESSLMAKMVTNFALEAGVDVVLDGVNAERGKTEKKVLKAKNKNYRVVGRYLAANVEDTMPTAAERGFVTGREVPVGVQIHSAEALMEALNIADTFDDKGNLKSRIWEIFDDFQLIQRDKVIIPGEAFTFTPLATFSNEQGDTLIKFEKDKDGSVEAAREMHRQYVETVNLTPAQRTRKLNTIKKEMKLRQLQALKRLKTISNKGELNGIEKEVMGLYAYLQKTYPNASERELDFAWRRIVSELSAGKISDKTFSKLIDSSRLEFLELKTVDEASNAFMESRIPKQGE